MKIHSNYRITEAISFYLDAEKTTIEEMARLLKVTPPTLGEALKTDTASPKLTEDIYSLLYRKGYRINITHEQISKESKKDKILFHGSKFGLSEITPIGSRKACDFGLGFYLGESYSQALSFVCENDASSVYSFVFHPAGELRIQRFGYDFSWMLAVSYYRGSLRNFASHPKVQAIVKTIEEADLVIAPIADNRMFYIMSEFAFGNLNADVALHALLASELGYQYIFKTEKSLSSLNPLFRYYLCQAEKEASQTEQKKRADIIETKLKMASREFRNGLYIEEILK